MVNKRRLLTVMAATIFTALECTLFYMIHFLNADPLYKLRFGCIIAATTFAWLTLAIKLITAKKENEKLSKIIFNASDGNLIRIAMIFTLVADYFMVAISEADNMTGITVFTGTQFFIFLHIFVNDKNAKSRIANVIIRITLSIALVLAVKYILGDSSDMMAIISVIYYANLCTNAIFAHRIGRGGIMLTIGLILFALCDINVGLSGLESIYEGGFPEGSLLYMIMNANVDLIWIFYIPSQTLIPLTLTVSKRK